MSGGKEVMTGGHEDMSGGKEAMSEVRGGQGGLEWHSALRGRCAGGRSAGPERLLDLAHTGRERRWMALFILTEHIDEGLCGLVTLEAPSREAALAFVLAHWDRLRGAFGGAFKDLDAYLWRHCAGRGLGVGDLSPGDLDAILTGTRT